MQSVSQQLTPCMPSGQTAAASKAAVALAVVKVVVEEAARVAGLPAVAPTEVLAAGSTIHVDHNLRGIGAGWLIKVLAL